MNSTCYQLFTDTTLAADEYGCSRWRDPQNSLSKPTNRIAVANELRFDQKLLTQCLVFPLDTCQACCQSATLFQVFQRHSQLISNCQREFCVVCLQTIIRICRIKLDHAEKPIGNSNRSTNDTFGTHFFQTVACTELTISFDVMRDNGCS